MKYYSADKPEKRQAHIKKLVYELLAYLPLDEDNEGQIVLYTGYKFDHESPSITMKSLSEFEATDLASNCND